MNNSLKLKLTVKMSCLKQSCFKKIALVRPHLLTLIAFLTSSPGKTLQSASLTKEKNKMFLFKGPFFFSSTNESIPTAHKSYFQFEAQEMPFSESPLNAALKLHLYVVVLIAVHLCA